MPAKRSQAARRKPRMDAQRNCERILEVAKEAFARSGASTSLDDIAKQAGVGAGTLYRHFPTREALLEAVYRTEVEKLAAAERKLAQDLSPPSELAISAASEMPSCRCGTFMGPTHSPI